MNERLRGYCLVWQYLAKQKLLEPLSGDDLLASFSVGTAVAEEIGISLEMLEIVVRGLVVAGSLHQLGGRYYLAKVSELFERATYAGVLLLDQRLRELEQRVERLNRLVSAVIHDPP